MDHQISENKLILLYMIHEKENITETDLYDFILYRAYMHMDFFTIQDLLEDLIRQGLAVKIENEGVTYYTLLPEGDEVVTMFRSRIPHSIREDIRTYANDSFYRDSPLMSAQAHCEKTSEGLYEVTLTVMDYDRAVMTFIMPADTEESAERIQTDWLKKGLNVYMNLLKEMK